MNKRDRGFTLIELLVVITIIAVLVGLLFPVGNSVLNNSRKTQASADMSRITGSVTSYQADYGRLPINNRQLKSVANDNNDTVFGDHINGNGTYPNSYLFDVLRGITDPADDGSNKAPNPRQVVYFQSNNAKSATQPRSGLATQKVTNGKSTIE